MLALSPRPVPAGPAIVPGGLSALASIEASSGFRHVLLERLDALGEVAHQAADLAAAEQQQHDQQHHHPVPDAEATHKTSETRGTLPASVPATQRHGAMPERMQADSRQRARCRRKRLTGYSSIDRRTDCEEGSARVSLPPAGQYRQLGNNNDGGLATGAGASRRHSVALLYNWASVSRDAGAVSPQAERQRVDAQGHR